MAATHPRHLLVLGGTTEASSLVRRLADDQTWSVTTSLAGRTANPTPLPGAMRSGGFGGAQGLVDYLRAEQVHAVVDATHPFAAVMRWHAFDACDQVGVPRVRIERPGWIAGPDDRWTCVPTIDDAANAVASSRAARVFLTTGRTELASFAAAVDGRRWFLVRSIDRPDPLPVHPAEVVLAKGPFTLDHERSAMRKHAVDLLVTKNSGGDAAAPKLTAARELGIPVVMVDRPPSPVGPEVATVDAAIDWLNHSAGAR